jgi:hypothetical protein
MAHLLKHKVTVDLVDRTSGKIGNEDVVSAEAIAIHEAYVASGKITIDVSESDAEEGSYWQSITFVDSAACDAYLAEMAAINEFETSGSSRSEQTRADV